MKFIKSIIWLIYIIVYQTKPNFWIVICCYEEKYELKKKNDSLKSEGSL